MTLPYQSATTGKRAMDEIQKHLRQFGCSKFATGEDYDTGEIFIQFEHRGRLINMKASANGYAEAWLKENFGHDVVEPHRLKYKKIAK